MRIRSSWPQPALFILFCCVVLMSMACGVKALPRPPREPDLPKVKDLDAVIIETGVQLTWSIPFGAEEVKRFNIYRSKPETVEKPCPACPREYELIRTVKAKVGRSYFQVFDRDFEAEGRYYYRVIPLDEKRRLGPDSNEAEVIVKRRRDWVK